MWHVVCCTLAPHRVLGSMCMHAAQLYGKLTGDNYFSTLDEEVLGMLCAQVAPEREWI